MILEEESVSPKRYGLFLFRGEGIEVGMESVAWLPKSECRLHELLCIQDRQGARKGQQCC